MCCIAPSKRVEHAPEQWLHGLNYDDERLLHAIEDCGTLSPQSAEERHQCERLLREGYLQSPASPAPPGQREEPLLCQLSATGKEMLTLH